MKQKIKAIIKIVAQCMLTAAKKTRIGEYAAQQLLDASISDVRQILHEGTRLTLSVPNMLCNLRANTFATKEPETLEWIDSLPEGSILWDVGANIGLYSTYAAKRKKCRVWAFEPSVFNLELLARNIYLNELVPLVCIVPFALSNAMGSNRLKMTSTDWGGALSTFGENFGWDGQVIKEVFEFQTMGMPMDAARDLMGIPQPEFIKLDVDGIEHLILSGGKSVLRGVKEVLIEVNDDFKEQSNGCEHLLRSAGLVLKRKLHSEMIDNSEGGFQNTYNQIWVREQG